MEVYSIVASDRHSKTRRLIVPIWLAHTMIHSYHDLHLELSSLLEVVIQGIAKFSKTPHPTPAESSGGPRMRDSGTAGLEKVCESWECCCPHDIASMLASTRRYLLLSRLEDGFCNRKAAVDWRRRRTNLGRLRGRWGKTILP